MARGRERETGSFSLPPTLTFMGTQLGHLRTAREGEDCVLFMTTLPSTSLLPVLSDGGSTLDRVSLSYG